VTCTEFLKLLDDLIEDTVSASLRSEVEQHLRKCGHCEVVFNTTRKTIEIYRCHEIYELPPDLRERLHESIMAKCKGRC
jgi:hypothetical protein